MAKIKWILEDTEYCREASEIEFTIPDDMTIQEYKIICKRLASAMGYQDTTIQRAFGNSEYKTQYDDDLQKLFNSLLSDNPLVVKDPLSGSGLF